MQRAWGGLRAYDGPTSSAMKSFCSSQSSLGFRLKQPSEPYDGSGICFECHHIYPQRWSMTSTLSKLVGSDLAADRRNVGPTACPSSWRWQTSDRAKSKYSPWTEVGGGGRRHSLRRAVPSRRLKSSKLSHRIDRVVLECFQGSSYRPSGPTMSQEGSF